jgi:hypothetical protein
VVHARPRAKERFPPRTASPGRVIIAPRSRL